MMYRPHAAQHPRPDATVAKSFVTMAAHKVLDYLAAMGVYEVAQRENRRWNRTEKRKRQTSTYFAAGLNGARAVARRARQRVTGHSHQAFGFV